jgi:HYR domain/Secretion system C-terminal sorting domain/Dockerin type I domain
MFKFHFKSILFNAVLLFFFFFTFSNDAFASHFRYANVSWKKTAPLTVEFKVSIAVRRDYASPSLNVGSSFSEPSFGFGDGTSINPNFIITSVNSGDNWAFGEVTFSHTYTSSSSYTAGVFDCCRISSLANAANGNFNFSTNVDLTSSNSSPVSAFSPTVCVPANSPNSTFFISASDSDGDALTYSLNSTTSGIGSYPSGLSISNTGLVTFNTTGIPSGSTYAVQVLISDGKTSVPVDFVISVVTSTSLPPVFDYTVTPANSATVAASVGALLSINIKATDPDAADMVSLSIVGQPSGTTFSPSLPALANPSTTTLNWTPTVADAGQSYVINVVASSGACEVAISSFTIQVGAACIAPVFTCPADITTSNTVGQCSATVNYLATATANPDLTYTFSGATTGSGSGTGSGSVFNVGVTTVKVTATNTCGTDNCSFTVTVQDAEKPVFTTCPTNMTVNNTVGRCDAVVNFAVTATDNCTSPQAVSQTAGLVSGAIFPVGTTTNSFTATDGAGNTVAAPCTFTVTVKDAEKPVITCPASQTITLGSFECNRVMTFAAPSVSDNCSATFSRTDALTAYNSGSSFGAGTYPLSYRATDLAGNFADCNFTIQVNGQSTTGRLKCLPTLMVSLNERQCINTLDAAGLLIDNIYYCSSFYNTNIAGRTGSYLNSADIGKTLTVTVGDNSNNSCSTLVTVVDTKAPVLNTVQDEVISCAEVSRDGRILANLSQPTIIYECSRTTFRTQDRVINLPAGQTAFTTKPDDFPADKNFNFTLAYNANKIIIRTYTATDESNNSSIIRQAIYVKNIELYQVQCPKDVTLSCTQTGFSTNIQSTGTPFMSNGRLLQDVSCGIDYLYSDERTNNTQGYVIKRTWTLISRLNNQRQNCTQTITVNCVNIPLLALSGSMNKETGESVSAMVKVYTPTEMMTEMQGGSFLFNNLVEGNSYRIQPERDNDVTNGVTTFDIALLSKHILGIQPFASPYQMIAADVNRDGGIDATDMILIRNLILRRITRFPSNTAWRFIPKNFVFTDNKNPFADDFPEVLNYNTLSTNDNKADFVAVKVGDVNLNANVSNALALSTRTARPTENIYLMDKKMEAGKEYVFDVNIKNSTLKALQLALKIDKTKVTSFSVEGGNLPQFETGNFEVNQKQGIVGMAWVNTKREDLSNENSIIQLKITPRQSAWLHELVSLEEQDMNNLAYNTEGIEKQIQLKYNTVKTDNVEFELHQNRPNPFMSETTISFVLPETDNATLSIYDVNGREVYTFKQSFNKGYNEVKLDKTVLKNAGIYFYRLQADKFTAVKRLQFFAN